MEYKVKAKETAVEAQRGRLGSDEHPGVRLPPLSYSSGRREQAFPQTPAHAPEASFPSVPGRRWTRTLREAFKTDAYNQAVCVTVILNAICMAAKVDAAHDTRYYALLNAAEHLFALLYLAEALAKVAVFGARDVLASRTLKFELAIAIFGALDLFVIDFRHFGLISDNTGFNVLPLFRILRFCSVFRHGQLALISRCFFAAFDTLWHITLFLFLIVFVFAIPTTKLIGQNPIYDDNFYNIRVAYGTVPHTWYSLMQMVINPDIFMMQNLFERQPWTAPFMMIFLGLTTYTSVSLIFGCVTDQYAKYSEAAQEQAEQHKTVANDEIRKDLLQELHEADDMQTGLHGALNKDEFARHFDSSKFQNSLQKLGVEEDTCQELLELLEVDGHVYYEEFVQALGLIGKGAQATHVLWLRAHMAEDVKRLEARMAGIEKHMEESQAAFADLEKKLTQRIDRGFAALRA